mmetsp:Transcript_95457/g.242594  ORF Transcript_95457/g.242594 Transcript_95457/m.242594 type:complete len:269 (-) Transcript_95457:20-826(-)
MEVIASCASPWLWNVIQHSWLPMSNFSNSPNGLKMPRMSSSVTTGRRFLMCNFRMLRPEELDRGSALRPVSTCWVNCCLVIIRFGAGPFLTSCASARFTCSGVPMISFMGGGRTQARVTASASANSTTTIPVGMSWRLRKIFTSATVPHLLKWLKMAFSSAFRGMVAATMVFSRFSTLPVKPPNGMSRDARPNNRLTGVRERLGLDSPPPPAALARRFFRLSLRRKARELAAKSRSSSKKLICAKSTAPAMVPARNRTGGTPQWQTGA